MAPPPKTKEDSMTDTRQPANNPAQTQAPRCPKCGHDIRICPDESKPEESFLFCERCNYSVTGVANWGEFFPAATPSSSPETPARIAEAEKALAAIAACNSEVCGCTHEDEECCAKVGEDCTFCIASVALSAIRQPLPDPPSSAASTEGKESK